MKNTNKLFNDDERKINSRPCDQCRKNFIIKTGGHRFCSVECRKKYHMRDDIILKDKAAARKNKRKLREIAKDRKIYEDYKKLHPDN